MTLIRALVWLRSSILLPPNLSEPSLEVLQRFRKLVLLRRIGQHSLRQSLVTSTFYGEYLLHLFEEFLRIRWFRSVLRCANQEATRGTANHGYIGSGSHWLCEFTIG